MTILPTPIPWDEMYPRAKQRFPHLHPGVPNLERDRLGFVAYLARTHHLTLREAQEEVEDFLFTESLHAELEQDTV
jgi:hypothetical protein